MMASMRFTDLEVEIVVMDNNPVAVAVVEAEDVVDSEAMVADVVEGVHAEVLEEVAVLTNPEFNVQGPSFHH